MLLRFAAENIMSFKDGVEFNTFPASKTHSHDWHKIECGHATALRLSAIYGANGAGKSNLLKCICLLKSIVSHEKLGDVAIDSDLCFRLDNDGKSAPSELAIEFCTEGKIFYYHIRFTRNEVVGEQLFLSQKNNDVEIFRRNEDGLKVSSEFMSSAGSEAELFVNAMKRVIRPDMSALSFFGTYYAQEMPLVHIALDWLKRIQVVLPTMRTGFLPHLLEVDTRFAALVNSIVPDLHTGINRLDIRKEVITDEDARGVKALLNALTDAKENPGQPQLVMETKNGEIANIVVEDGCAWLKTLVAIHKDADGNDVEMSMDMESDGTRRLVEYMPLLYSLLKRDGVFLIDEIERSVHPIMIKTLINKISEDREARGQLIFTTHESALLDQSIFRPDEIWFAQKDVNQATQLYPLSDYNIHRTANIENGYLNGRYGGIPFLSNLADLKW